MKKKFISYPIYSRQKSNKNEQNINLKIKQTFNIKSNNKSILQNRIYSQRQRLPSIERMLDINPSRKQSINNLRTSIQVKKAQFSNQKTLNTIKTNKISSSIQIKQSLNTIQSDKHLNLNNLIGKRANQTLQNEENNQIFNTKINTKKVIVARNRKEFSKLNQQLIYDIRQNVLNSNYQKRKNRLNVITKQNKKIHQRINSQKSSYSNRDLNKSYESNASISKRLSNSKISRNSKNSYRSNNSSQCSIRSIDRPKPKYTKQTIKVQQRNINDLQSEQIKNLALLFNQKHVLLNKKSSRTQKTIQQQKHSYKQNKATFQTISQLPKIKQIKRLINTPIHNRHGTARILSTINENLMESTNKMNLNQIVQQYSHFNHNHNQHHNHDKLNNLKRNSLVKKMNF